MYDVSVPADTRFAQRVSARKAATTPGINGS